MERQMELTGDTADSNALTVPGGLEDGSSSDLLKAKIAELEKMKEELKQAKEEATQSWLDSRPLIDELEKMQAELASAKERVLKANTTAAELQAQVGTTDMCIKSAKVEERKSRMIINDKNQALHKTQEEMEQLKLKIDQKRRKRSKLKLVLRLKRQTLQTMQLTCEAIQLESEAFRTSAAQALRYINNLEGANIMVQLTQKEYDYLRKEASEQTSLAEWRISVSAEEKLAAENSRDSAFRRLQNLNPHLSRPRKMGQRINEKTIMRRTGLPYSRVGSQTSHRQFSKDQVESPTGVHKGNPQQQSKNNYNLLVKKKKSIFFRIKTFIVQKITKYFK